MAAGLSRPLTREDLDKAFAFLQEDDRVRAVTRAERIKVWVAFRLDWSAMTTIELIVCNMAMEGVAMHPKDAEVVAKAVERCRRA